MLLLLSAGLTSFLTSQAALSITQKWPLENGPGKDGFLAPALERMKPGNKGKASDNKRDDDQTRDLCIPVDNRIKEDQMCSF